MKSDFVVEVQHQNPSWEHTLICPYPFVRIHFQVINKKLAMLEGDEKGGCLFSEGGLVFNVHLKKKLHTQNNQILQTREGPHIRQQK